VNYEIDVIFIIVDTDFHHSVDVGNLALVAYPMRF